MKVAYNDNGDGFMLRDSALHMIMKRKGMDCILEVENMMDINRHDPDLIAVIEELGSEASEFLSKVVIQEIPDGVLYEIEEYGGYEEVVPPRMTWEQAMEKGNEASESTAPTPRA